MDDISRQARRKRHQLLRAVDQHIGYCARGRAYRASTSAVWLSRRIRRVHFAVWMSSKGSSMNYGIATESKISEVKEACARYGASSIVALSGVPGTGKSFIASIAA